jgi:glucosamine 6-phosphate synthetase-like amidotransferase/phosphosugar isomerase protein
MSVKPRGAGIGLGFHRPAGANEGQARAGDVGAQPCGGELFVFSDADTRIESGEGLHVIRMPENYGALSPLLHVVPLQLQAYHTACGRGTQVDKPRNLAKPMTVE